VWTEKVKLNQQIKKKVKLVGDFDAKHWKEKQILFRLAKTLFFD
jgi:hypothetical protein